MRCHNCQTELPASARYCLNCGAPQPESEFPAAEQDREIGEEAGQDSAFEKKEEFNWLEREARLDPTIDYEAMRRYEGTTGALVGCLFYSVFVVVGLLVLIPAVPILAVFGLPLSIILGLLVYTNLANFGGKIRSVRFLSKLPGFHSASRTVLALAVGGYLAAASILSLLLMVITTRR